MWDLLQWGGKHPQAPVAVVQKPHYFAELDLRATLNTLAMEDPGFWVGEEMAREAGSGGGVLLQLDPTYWVKVCAMCMHVLTNYNDGWHASFACRMRDALQCVL